MYVCVWMETMRNNWIYISCTCLLYNDNEIPIYILSVFCAIKIKLLPETMSRWRANIPSDYTNFLFHSNDFPPTFLMHLVQLSVLSSAFLHSFKSDYYTHILKYSWFFRNELHLETLYYTLQMFSCIWEQPDIRKS